MIRATFALWLLVPTLAWGQGAPAPTAPTAPPGQAAPKPAELSEVEHLRLLVEQLQADRSRLEVIWARDRGLLAKAQAEIRRLQGTAAKP
jgi:nucleoid-associated protein YgaU